VAAPRPAAAVPACLLAWLLPGAGHFYLRRTRKGLVFLGAIGALFVLGLAMDSRLQMAVGLDDILASLFSLAQMAIGLPYFAARMLGYEAGSVTSVTYEYGNTPTAVAGQLNILDVLDAHDVAVGRKA
jgi:TM2 domain-containing membrane protein YozV